MSVSIEPTAGSRLKNANNCTKNFATRAVISLDRSTIINSVTDEFLRAAYEEAVLGREEGGIPIGSVLVHNGKIIGRGHNRRVQKSSVVLHGEMDALENAGRLRASV